MKRIGKIIAYIFGGLVIAFSLVFGFIEGRNLFSGDWLLYENVIDGFIRYFFRFILAIFSLAIGISTYFILRKSNESETLSLYYRFGVLSFLTSSIVVGCFSSNYIDLLFIILTIIYSFGVTLYFYSEKISVISHAKNNN